MEAHQGDTPLVEAALSGLSKEGSLLDALAQERDEIAANTEVDIAIPGYKAVKLFARYRLMDGKELNEIGRKVQKEFRKKLYEQNLYGSIDVFIAACVGIFYQTEDSDEMKPLTNDGVPVTGYTPELAAALRFTDKIDPHSPARSIVFAVFGNNETAIQGHNLRLGRWMQDTSTDVNEDFLQGN